MPRTARLLVVLLVALFVAACPDSSPGPSNTAGADTGEDVGEDSARDSGDPGEDTGEGDTGEPGDPVEIPRGAPILLEHVTVVDANGVRADWYVLIEGPTIRAAGAERPQAPANAAVINARGLYLIPGLVDPHVHMNLNSATIWLGPSLEDNLRAQLAFGVTAVMDVGGPAVLFEVRDAIARGALLGPKMKATGPFLTVPGGHPCELGSEPSVCRYVTVADARSHADDIIGQGADALKVVLADTSSLNWPAPSLHPDAVRAASNAGRPVVAHIDTNGDLLDAIGSGASILAHPVFIEPLSDEARDAAGGALGVHSTLTIFRGTPDLIDGTLDIEDPDFIVSDSVRANWRYVRQNVDALFPAGWVEASHTWTRNARDNVAILLQSGAHVIPASDAGSIFVPHGKGLHNELVELEALGEAPLDLLARATLDARVLIGLDGGLIEAGAPADLVLLTDDPSASTRALSAIHVVFVDGQPWSNQELRSVDLMTTPSGEEGLCLEDADCSGGLRCDLTHYRCRDACDPPYVATNACGAESWCAPQQGLFDDNKGVCHPTPTCDLYDQDCGPAYYNLACVPADLDTNLCWPAGPRRPGQSCSFQDPTLQCEKGSFCSAFDSMCYELCDPAGDDTCGAGQRCVRQFVNNALWFGICLAQ